MSRRGDNIHKRSDGRWEGRYISGRKIDGKAKYSSVYAKSYAECAAKLKLARCSVLPKPVSITTSELFYLWLEGKKSTIKRSTYTNYLQLFNRYVIPHFGSMAADKINAYMFSSFINDLISYGGANGQGLSPITVRAIMTILRSVLKYGELEYGITNAAKNITLPKARSNDISIFNDDEIIRIKRAAFSGSNYEFGIVLSLYTGIRIGELCALTWGDIDIVNQVVHINKSLSRISEQGMISKTTIIIDRPKSKNSVRDVPIPPFMLATLTRMKAIQSDKDYFLTCSCKYTEPRSYSLRYKTFLKSLEIPYRCFHSLRHTFATECIKCGVDVKTLCELLGHSSVKITLEKYVHPDMNMKKQQLEKLYSAL